MQTNLLDTGVIDFASSSPNNKFPMVLGVKVGFIVLRKLKLQRFS